jgi:hypothetical protein
MGWWKIENSDDLVGDDVFDMLRDATERVAAEYLREFGRRPTRSEWQHLIQDALEPIEDLNSAKQESLFAENSRPQKVEIVLESLSGRQE